MSNLKRGTYHVKGMHCASCELSIENKLLEFDGVEFADCSLSKGEVVFEYSKEKPKTDALNHFFSNRGYVFSERSLVGKQEKDDDSPSALGVALAIIVAFILLEKFGLSSLLNLTQRSAWPAFLAFGVIAGLSSCAALVGGLLLSLSKQWQEHYGYSAGAVWEPNLLFNSGRVVSYALFGLALGFVGQTLQLSLVVSSGLLLIVSALMAVLALQMLGVKAFQKFRIALPKNLTRKVAKGSMSGDKKMPFVFGFLTILLPCGFTLMAEGLAILSGEPLRGAVMMAAFAVGTALPLIGIGVSSAKFLRDESKSEKFLRVAGILILFFVFYNLNVQFHLVDFDRLTSFALTGSAPTENVGTVSTSSSLGGNGVTAGGETQVIETVYTLDKDIQPNTFTVKKGQPVSFRVKVLDNGQGCMSTILVRDLYKKPIYLEKGQTIVMDFTPTELGDYQIICAMGVPRGTIKVTD